MRIEVIRKIMNNLKLVMPMLQQLTKKTKDGKHGDAKGSCRNSGRRRNRRGPSLIIIKSA
jgi:hypothetical protein